MAIDYAHMANVALQLLTDRGRGVELLRIERAPDNPSLPWRGSGAQVNLRTPVTAVFVDPVSEKDLGRRTMRGPEDSVVSGKQIAFIAASENPGVDFTTYDRLLDTDTGLAYTLKEVNLLSPGGTPLLWAIEVER